MGPQFKILLHVNRFNRTFVNTNAAIHTIVGIYNRLFVLHLNRLAWACIHTCLAACALLGVYCCCHSLSLSDINKILNQGREHTKSWGLLQYFFRKFLWRDLPSPPHIGSRLLCCFRWRLLLLGLGFIFIFIFRNRLGLRWRLCSEGNSHASDHTVSIVSYSPVKNLLELWSL